MDSYLDERERPAHVVPWCPLRIVIAHVGFDVGVNLINAVTRARLEGHRAVRALFVERLELRRGHAHGLKDVRVELVHRITEAAEDEVVTIRDVAVIDVLTRG